MTPMATLWITRGQSWPRDELLAVSDGYVVYRVYGRPPRPLYVGSTCDLLRRMGEHRRRSEWWSKARKIAVTRHVNRRAACAVEGRAIRELRPTHNSIGTLVNTWWPSGKPIHEELSSAPECRVVGMDREGRMSR